MLGLGLAQTQTSVRDAALIASHSPESQWWTSCLSSGSGSDSASDDGDSLRLWLGRWTALLTEFDTLCSKLRRRQIVGSAETARITVELLRNVVRARDCMHPHAFCLYVEMCYSRG